MPSRPLSADTKAVVKLHTRLDVEAIDIAKGRTEMPAAVLAVDRDVHGWKRWPTHDWF